MRRVLVTVGMLWVVILTPTGVSSDAPPDDSGMTAPITSSGSGMGSPVVGKLKFSHDMHTDDLELECTECHHETHAAQLDISHDDYFDDFWIDCQSCHNTATAQEPQSCANCHHSSVEDVADETRSAKVVLHQSCWSCHEVSTGVEASESCSMCHVMAGGDL